jgi:hypothetical protein
VQLSAATPIPKVKRAVAAAMREVFMFAVVDDVSWRKDRDGSVVVLWKWFVAGVKEKLRSPSALL